MISSNYNILFKIELLHEYFSNRQCPDFDIIPSDDTRALFNKARIICRNSERSFSAIAQQNGSGEPFFNTAETKNFRKDFGKSVFRFYLKLKNPLFFNYTNINFDFTSRRKFYFSNLSQNSGAGYLFLSAPVSSFALNTEYVPGNLARDPATGQVYEALKKYTSKKKTELADPLVWSAKSLANSSNGIAEFSTGKSYNTGDLVKQPKTENVFEAARKYTASKPDELTDPSLWIARAQGQLQYANDNDVIECSAASYNFIVAAPVNKAEMLIMGFNYDPSAPAYDLPVSAARVINFDKPVGSVPFDLSTLPAGRYQLKVNDEVKTIYYDPAMNAGNVFGVVEIFNYLPAADPYSLLTGDEKIKNTSYQVVFAARSVLWKYIRKDGKAQTITDSGTTAYKFALQGDGFVSSSPIPLSENILKTLTLEFNTTDFKLSPLPNPSPDRFSRCTQNDYDYLCSEVYLNY